MTIDQAFQIALQHHQTGRLAQAEQLYRQILAQQPDHANALHLLGVVAHQGGRNEIAIDSIRRAIALKPDFPEAYGNLGVVLDHAGKLDEAIAAYRQAITLKPGYTEAHNNLGNALKDRGQPDEAIASYRRAIAFNPSYPEAHANLGNVLLEKGELDEAIGACREAIALRPAYPEAHYNLGNALKAKGQLDEAFASYRRAITLRPDWPEAHNNLGNALRADGQLDAAIATYRQAIDVKPDLPEAHSNLGDVLREKGCLDAAIAACRRAIALRPGYAAAHYNLGNALRTNGQFDAAIPAYRQAVALKGDYLDARINLGNALRELGQLDDAIAAYRQAIALKGDYPEAYSNLGNALRDKGQLDEAIAACRHAIALRPDYADAHSNLGNALWEQGQLDQAIASHRQAVALKPDMHETHTNLGVVLKDAGQVDEAITCCRQAMTLNPDDPDVHGNVIFTMHYCPGYDARAIADEQRRWNLRFADPMFGTIRAHETDRDPGRRLRIGYVSPDLRKHPVGGFLLPLLAHHDKSKFEIFAYAQVPVPDEMTQRLRSHTDQWRSIVGLSDARVADQIRQDRIDILVDLAMHTGHNRLLVFARKPAPVQVTWLAYCSSTGLQTIDYRLSDPYLDPPGADESIYTEKTIRLPETYWCYQQIIPTARPGPLPALQRGEVCFGCLNNFCKINESVLAAWAGVLRAVPNSQLLLHAREGNHRQRFTDRMEREGIASHRVRFAGKLPIEKYFELYRQIDIALDTFPFGGGTTTCDALWMGVPVVSLAGKTAVGRGGLSILSNVGLPELVAGSEDEYVKIATDLAGDLPRLSRHRAELRQRMERSPLMDAPRFARNIESAYRQMWREWCTGRSGPLM